ncbi:MAG: MFS transporter [Candidatus Hinthialibacter antarcticus]|nr:MFS transporter [Candidatus Hinthialibacter antarcticus]
MSHGHSEHTKLYTATFVLGFAYNFFMGFLFSSNALYPLYVDFAGGGPEEIGLFMAVFPLAGMMGRPLHGALVDRFGVKRMMIAGAMLYSLPCLGYIALVNEGLTPAVWVLRLIQGFGFGAHVTAFFTLAAQMAPKGRSNEAVAMYGVSGMVASLAGPLLSELTIKNFGLPAFFWFMLFMGGAAVILAMLIRAPRAVGAVASFSFAGIKTVAVLPRFRLAFFFSFCLAISFTTMSAFIAPVMESRDVSFFGLFFTGYAVTGITTRFAGRKWADQFGFLRILAPGFFCYGTGLLLLQFSHSLPMLIFAGVCCGAGHGLVFPIITTFGYVLAPVGYRGAGIALMTGMMDFGNAVTAFALGRAAEAYGYNIVFALGCIAPYAAVLMIAYKGRQYAIENLATQESS